MKLTFSFVLALACFLLNTSTATTAFVWDVEAIVTSIVSVTATGPFVVPVLTIPDSSVDEISTIQVPITTTGPFAAPVATIPDSPTESKTAVSTGSVQMSTTSAPSMTSTRPEASGFWSDSDPFSFVPPSSWSTLTKMSGSTSSMKESTTVVGPPASTSSTTSSQPPTMSFSSTTITSIESSTSTTPDLSTSISTHTNIVTASNVQPMPATSTIGTPQATTSSSDGRGAGLEFGQWLGLAFIMVAQDVL